MCSKITKDVPEVFVQLKGIDVNDEVSKIFDALASERWFHSLGG